MATLIVLIVLAVVVLVTLAAGIRIVPRRAPASSSGSGAISAPSSRGWP